MTITKMILVLACLVSIPLETKEAKVTTLMSKDLTEFPGKEGVMITVEYPPGSTDPIHRHNAHAFIYVLEGSMVMQVRGGEEVTLTPGQTFYEGPNDVHVVGRNASQTHTANIRSRRKSKEKIHMSTITAKYGIYSRGPGVPRIVSPFGRIRAGLVHGATP